MQTRANARAGGTWSIVMTSYHVSNIHWNHLCRGNFSIYISECWIEEQAQSSDLLRGIPLKALIWGCCTPVRIHWLLWGLGDFTRGHTVSIATFSDRYILILLLWPPRDCGRKSWEITLDSTQTKGFLTKGLQPSAGCDLMRPLLRCFWHILNVWDPRESRNVSLERSYFFPIHVFLQQLGHDA